MDINVKISAPELVDALNAVAAALGGKIVNAAAQQTAAPENAKGKSTPKTDTKKAAEQKPLASAPAQESIVEEPATEPETDTSEEPLEEVKEYTTEEVRAKLTALSQSGKQAQVKALITKYGAARLSDIPADKYAAVMAEAEAMV